MSAKETKSCRHRTLNLTLRRCRTDDHARPSPPATSLTRRRPSSHRRGPFRRQISHLGEGLLLRRVASAASPTCRRPAVSLRGGARPPRGHGCLPLPASSSVVAEFPFFTTQIGFLDSRLCHLLLSAARPRVASASPACVSTSMEWCQGNADSAVRDAILYCKKSSVCPCLHPH
jgi:hypothetical protein